MVRYTEEQFKNLIKRSNTSYHFKPNSSLVSTGYKSNVKGWRTIGGKKYYFKSLWEIQYAQTLEWQKKQKNILDWEYEPYIFEFPKDKYRTGPFYYKPDYKVTNLDYSIEWHEVKGYLTKDAKKKMTRFKKHYPKEKYVLIESKWFQAMRKKKMHLIIGWEKLNPISS